MEKQKTCEVVVIGGGAAGIAAACASASLGKRVALIETAPYLGGKATAAYVGTICGAYFRSETPDDTLVCGGFPATFVKELTLRSHTEINREKEGIQFLPYEQFQFKKLSDELCQAAGVELYLQSTVYAAEKTANKITALHALVGPEKLKFNTEAVVDCSGNAIVADLLQLQTISSDKYQASAKVFGLSGMDPELDLANLKLALYKGIKKGLQEKALDTRLQHVSVVPGSYKHGNIYLKIGLPTLIGGAMNELTTLNIEGRNLIQEIVTYLQSEVTSFKKAQLSNVPSEVGIRTGKRHLGRAVLTQEWVMQATKSSESIARGAWPIEKWDYGHKPEMRYFAEGDYYDITGKSLASDQLENLYFGGRNISADDEAIASARVIGTCLQTGYAAGILASRQSMSPEVIKEIQTKLELV